MRACILAIAALLLATGAGCRGINLCNGGCNSGCNGGCNCGGHGHGGHFARGADGCDPGGCDPRLLGGHGGYGGHGGLLGHGGTGGPLGIAAHHQSREYLGPAGPPTAQVAYPYYTTRGPRDFLIDNPPSIGR